MNRISIAILLYIFSFTAQGQEKGKHELVPVETFKIEAKVISVLEGRDDLAVLQMIRADKNPWDLKGKDEVLATFYYTTKKNSEFEGVKSGDTILADLHGELNTNTVQVDYTVLHYSLVKEEAIKSKEAP